MNASNPTTTPAFVPTPVTRVSFLAAIRGPIVLIVLGVLFVLDYSEGISVGKTWPILLIVIGLLHLLGRVRHTRVSAPDDRAGGTQS